MNPLDTLYQIEEILRQKMRRPGITEVERMEVYQAYAKAQKGIDQAQETLSKTINATKGESL